MAVVWGLIAAGLMALAAVAAGALLLPLSARRGPRAEGLFLAWAMGYGMMSLAVFALGIPKAFTAGTAFALLAGMASVGLTWRWRWLADAVRGIAVVHRDRAATALAGLCGIPCVVALLWSLGPEVRGDSIIYHINAALLYVVNRGHVESPASALTYIPQNMQLLYALGLCVQGDTAARLTHWWFGMLLLLGTYALGRRAGLGITGGILAVSLMALFPIWIYLATSTYVDLGVAVYLLAAFLAAWRCVEGHRERSALSWAAVTGALLGFAMGCKYTAIVTGALPVMLVLVVEGVRRGRVRETAAAVLMCGVVALALFLPWLVRNWIWTGNPLAPSLMHLLGPWDVPQETLHWPDIQAGSPEVFLSPILWAVLVAAMFSELPDYGNYLFLVAPILGMLAVLCPGRGAGGREARYLAVAMLIFVIVAFMVGTPLGAVRRDSRYIMAQVAVVAVLCVRWGGVLMADATGRLRRLVGGAVLAVLAASWIYRTTNWVNDLNEAVIPPLSAEARADYERLRLKNYDRNVAISGKVQRGDERILGAAYPARVNYVLTGRSITPDLEVQQTDLVTTGDLAGLRRQGVRFLFGDVPSEVASECERVGEFGGAPLWRIGAD